MSLLIIVLSVLAGLVLFNFLLLKFSCNKVEDEKSVKKGRSYSMPDK